MGVFAGRGGAAKPTDYTSIKHSFAEAAGGATSTANDLVTWMSALLGGRVLNAEYQKKWLDSIQPEDPAKPDGARYGYGIAQFSWAGNTVTHSTPSLASTPPTR